MSAAPIDLILDVDTGVDDALALLLAARHKALRLRAVTCVAGNTTLAKVVRNTRAVLDLAGAGDVAVGAGADRPLIEPYRGASAFHGADGLGDIVLPDPPPAAIAPALDVLRRTIAACERPPTLLALGPLTNIALLIRVDPASAARLAGIVFVGGSAAIGNATAVAEFNLWSDPEAAAIVVGAPCPVTMYGLDVFYDAVLRPDDAAALASRPDPAARLAARLLAYLRRMDQAEGRVAGDDATTIGDAGALCAVIDPGGLAVATRSVSIVVDGDRARGQSIVDRRPRRGEGDAPGPRAGHRVAVAVGIEAGRYRRLYLDAFGVPPA